MIHCKQGAGGQSALHHKNTGDSECVGASDRQC